MPATNPARLDGPIVRCVKLIRLLTEIDKDISVKDAAQILDLPASTTHRLLRVLSQEGMVAKDPSTSRYRAGLDLERMCSLLAFKTGFRDQTRPYLQRIVDQCNEAAMFIGYFPATHQVSPMAAINASHPLRYEIVLYTPDSVAWGATGRSIFSFLPEQEQREIAASAGPSPVSGKLLPEWDELKAELDRIREAGYVLTKSQKLKGAVGLGTPIRNVEGRVIGSFCITVPEIRFEPSSEPYLASLVMEQAEIFMRNTGALR